MLLTEDEVTMDPHEIAAEVRRRIMHYPETHDQYSWTSGSAPNQSPCVYEDIGTSVEKWKDCGTTGCVAGHIGAVAVEAGYIPYNEDIPDFAARVLELENEEVEVLFDVDLSRTKVLNILAIIATPQILSDEWKERLGIS